MSYEEELAEYNRQINAAKGRKSKNIGCVCYVIAALFLAAAGITMVINHLSGKSTGTVGSLTETEITESASTEESGVSYILHADKDEMAEMDSHTWITYMTSLLAEAADEEQPWAVVLFGDGTGIFFPGADIYAEGIYAAIEDDGTVTEEYGQILVNGGNVSYTEYDGNMARSMDVLSLIGNEYYNDATYAYAEDIGDGQICVTVSVETDEEEQTAAETILERVMELDPFMVFITVNGTGYVWTEENGLTTMDEAEAAIMNASELTVDEAESELTSEEVQEILDEYGL